MTSFIYDLLSYSVYFSAVNLMLPSSLTCGKNSADKYDKFTHVSERQHSTPATAHEITFEKSSIKQSTWHQTVSEHAPGSNIWLRSSNKQTTGCHNCEFNPADDQDDKSDKLKVNHQVVTRGVVEGIRNQQDACPYNLRWRLMNT